MLYILIYNIYGSFICQGCINITLTKKTLLPKKEEEVVPWNAFEHYSSDNDTLAIYGTCDV